MRSDTDESPVGMVKARKAPAGAVEGYLDDLDKGLAMLGEELDRAHSTLSPVLRAEQPRPGLVDRNGADQAAQSALADRVESLASRLRTFVDAWSDVLDRVDL